ncbi:MAG TPA: Rad52/Rad22 family DNA repair protein [Chloroflexota bacterium]
MFEDDTYARLSAPFEVTFSDVRGGVEVTFISGEQVVSRLNEVLGAGGWSFRILRHEIHAEADEVWALGEIVADLDGKTVTRQQFGSQKIKRSRSTGVPLDLGFDLKGASTDAMKKCASLLGVGLYLSRKPASAARRAPYTATRGAWPDVRPGGPAGGAGKARALEAPARR